VADNKRFYWIKLKTDFFNIDKIDYIISRPNGCQYIVLYQMLCLMTANNNGKLCSTMGEIIVPYDIDKIVRETKYFDFDTVAMALNLFKQLGLIYQQEDSILRIAAIDEMVGSEAGNLNAQRQKRFRERKKQAQLENVKSVTQGVTKNNEDIDIRDKSQEIDTDKDINNLSNDKRLVGSIDALNVLNEKIDKSFNQWYNEHDSGIFMDFKPAERLKALFEKLSYTEQISINGVARPTDKILWEFTELFARSNDEIISLIYECFDIIDGGNVKNVFAYSIAVFYNKMKGI